MIEGLRGVAALSVLFYHSAHKAFITDTGPDALRAWTSHLDVGVSLFFLISGFLLYRPFVAARVGGREAPDRHAYARRRFWRIVPAYWVVLVLAGLAGLSYSNYPEIFSAKGIPAYFGFLQIYNANTAAGGINTAWTLCVEVTFYALLPVWAFALRKLFRGGGMRAEYLALAALGLMSVVWQVIAVHQVNPAHFGMAAAPWIEPLPNFLDQFAIGMALAVASVGWERRGPGRMMRAIAARPWIAWAVALGAYWAMSTQIGLSGALGEEVTPASYLALHGLKSLFAVGLLLPAVLPGSGGAVRGLTGSRPLLFAGALSYGIYLVQVPVMTGLIEFARLPRMDLADQILWLAVTTVACVVVAWLLHRLVELPAIRFGRRPRRAPETPVPEPAPAG